MPVLTLIAMEHDPRDEHRVFDRFGTTFPALIGRADGPDEHQALAARILDISVDGLRLETEERFTPGEEVQVGFTLPGDYGQEHMITTVRIVACDPRSESGTITVRGRFSKLEREALLRIGRWTLAESSRSS